MTPEPPPSTVLPRADPSASRRTIRVRRPALSLLPRGQAGRDPGDASGGPPRTPDYWWGGDPFKTHFLNALKDSIESGKTPADELLDLYHGEWDGDLSRIYAEFSY